MTGTTAQTDLVLMLLVLGLVGLVALAVAVAQDFARVRPALPDEDCPPPGLGRLVPTGGQVEQECRSGLAALESWLLTHRLRP